MSVSFVGLVSDQMASLLPLSDGDFHLLHQEDAIRDVFHPCQNELIPQIRKQEGDFATVLSSSA